MMRFPVSSSPQVAAAGGSVALWPPPMGRGSFVPMNDFSRRNFVRFLAGSPLFVAAGLDQKTLSRLFAGQCTRTERSLRPDRSGHAGARLIAAPGEALDIFDFEPVAKTKIPPAHWGYLITGTDDDATIKANRDGYSKWALRPRRLVDFSKLDTKSICSARSTRRRSSSARSAASAPSTPRANSPSRARRRRGIISRSSPPSRPRASRTSSPRAARRSGGSSTQQPDWNQTRAMIKRAEAAGAPAVVFTVDLLGGSNRETMFREAMNDTRNCIQCHAGGRPAPGVSGRVDDRDNRRKPALAVQAPGAPIPEAGPFTWDFVKRLKDTTSMKVFVKGLVTPRGRGTRDPARRERDVRQQPRRPRGQFVAGDGRVPARNREAGEGARDHRARRRHPPRHRHLQGARPRRNDGGHRAALHLGARLVRAGGSRGGAR